MATDAQHAFMSYVHEDTNQIDALCRVLDGAQLPYWRDRAALAPGDTWKAKIREAIQSGAVVFLACFSHASAAKPSSYMNEELTLAVEEFRKMPPGRTWLIPIRLDDVELPAWDLGGGRMLSDIHRVDFFGDRETATAALVRTILGLMGTQAPAATTLAAVDELVAADRPAGVRRLTKEMLLDPVRRIQLNDMVATEVRRVLAALDDEERYPTTTLPGDQDAQLLTLVGLAQQSWQLVEPFCWSVQVAARFSTPDALSPWAQGLSAFAAARNRPRGGRSDLLDLQGLPALVATFTAALACVGQSRWDNLKTLLIDTEAPESAYQSTTHAPLVEAVDPSPFRHAFDFTPTVLARSVVDGEDPAEALSLLNNRRVGKYHTPVPDWLHGILRPLFSEQFFTDIEYNRAFDRTEIVLGLLSQDQDLTIAARFPDRAFSRGSLWFGRSTWRTSYDQHNALAEIQDELDRQSSSWGLLRAGLFGGLLERARAASDHYSKAFHQVSSRRG